MKRITNENKIIKFWDESQKYKMMKKRIIEKNKKNETKNNNAKKGKRLIVDQLSIYFHP